MEIIQITRFSIEHLRNETDFFLQYCQLRIQLWPQLEDECEREAVDILADPQRWGVFLARLNAGAAIGFLEIRLRDCAEGASMSPVPFIEGWFVVPEERKRGVGKALIQAAESWAASRGYTEIASDTQIDNAVSIAAHKSLGYEEVERLVCFIKQLQIRAKPVS
ncbi:MAG: GNAT family N-acetyltransferase [Acidobacteriaceae bacterium]|nr:GNAT family N-acetyltransferase [Acidobacteriaceae bacterium]